MCTQNGNRKSCIGSLKKNSGGRFREARLGIEQLPLTEGKCTAGAKIFSTSGKSVKNRSKVKARPPCHVPLIYAG